MVGGTSVVRFLRIDASVSDFVIFSHKVAIFSTRIYDADFAEVSGGLVLNIATEYHKIRN